MSATPVTIVMIEDDEGHARLIERNIRRAGINNQIKHFLDGTTGLEFLLNDSSGPLLNGPSLILLDLNLPDMSGTDILARVKSEPRLKRTPVVVLTTTDDKAEIQRCYDLGANVYITKPVNYESFSEAIRQLGLFLSVIQVPEVEGVTTAEAGGVRLLYIDDDEGLCRLMQRRLPRRGFSVETRTSGKAGVEAAATGRFDVITVDHFMPEQDGLATLGQLKRLPDPPPVIYVTGSDESRLAVAALKAGASDYVVKSGTEDFSDLLASALEQAVERRRLQRTAREAEAQLIETNARLEAVVARQEALLREVNHRVANSLQLVSAMVAMQAAAVDEPDAKAALRDTQGRIGAIMQIHRRLYTSHDVERVDMQEYLQGLVAELAQSLPDSAERPIRLKTDPIQLDTDKAVSLGVVVTELVTNAIKYAYPAGALGEVRVALERDGAAVRLTVEDDGAGIGSGAAPKGTGLGQRVIAAMAKSLRSDLTLDPAHQGVRAVMTFAA